MATSLAHDNVDEATGDNDDFFDRFVFGPFQDGFVGVGEFFDFFFGCTIELSLRRKRGADTLIMWLGRKKTDNDSGS